MTITIDDFQKCDLRIGEIISAKKLEKSKKLLLLMVDIGEGKNRVILSGIARYISIDNLVGMKCLILVNLATREMCGYSSEGMLLGALNEENKFSLLVPSEDTKVGSRIS